MSKKEEKILREIDDFINYVHGGGHKPEKIGLTGDQFDTIKDYLKDGKYYRDILLYKLQ